MSIKENNITFEQKTDYRPRARESSRLDNCPRKTSGWFTTY